MAAEAQGGERCAYSIQAAAAPRGRVAEAVQAAPGAQQIGDIAQLATSGAVRTTGGWLHRGCQHKDVRGQEQLVAWRVIESKSCELVV